MTNNKIEIIPAILPMNFGNFAGRVEEIKDVAKTVHLDASDGVFTKKPSWPYNGEDTEKFEVLRREDEGLPFWDKVDYEMHLMVAEPEKKVVDWIRVGAMRVIVHTEAIGDFEILRDSVGGMTDLVIALKLETPLDVIKPFANRIEGIHIMTIAEIGRQGIDFDSRSVEKVKTARALFPSLPISVDGGVSIENARALVEAGASRLIVGSALFESENPLETYYELVKITQNLKSPSS